MNNNKQNPKVSVIIPTYNRAELVCEAIESILAQTYKDFEIIVVDDGSTDNTREVLSKYNGQIRYFYQENKKMPAAKNLGIREAKGEYIAFLDSDDIWLPEKLELQMRLFEDHPEVGLAHSDGCWFNEKGVVIDSQFKYLHMIIPRPDDYLLNLFLNRIILVSSSVVIRKSCFEKAGLYDEMLITNSDFDIQCRIARFYNIGCVNQVLVKTRLGHQDKMTANEERLYQCRLRAMEKLANLYPEIINGNILKKGFAKMHYNLGRACFLNKDFNTAKANFWQSIIKHPFSLRKYLYWALSNIYCLGV